MAKLADNTEEVRAQILDAADLRFRQYGYGKTTMAEIAKDCGMSAANLYRFFENKQDIGASLAQRCLNDYECRLNSAVTATVTATAQLKVFILETLRYTYEQWSKQPRINEMVQAVIADRPDIVERHKITRQSIVTDIIKEGVAQGEFDAPNAETTSETLLNIITVISVPMFMHLYSLREFERMAKDMTDLVLKGLRKR